MALKIRRGLETDRSSVTPEEGEFLYVTDTGLLYIGDGTTAGGNLVAGGGLESATASGTDTYTATITGVSAYTTHDIYEIIFTNANTGSSTININGLGAKTLKKSVSTNLASGDILAGQSFIIVFDGTNFQVIGLGGGGSGDVTGPASSTDGSIVLYDGTTGKVIKDSGKVLSTVGGNIAALTNPSAITFLRLNADNTVTARSASDFRADISAVGLTGNETIAGVKTFSSFPVTPSSAPTTDYQTANKKYVDDEILAATGVAPDYTGKANNVVTVNSTETALDYIPTTDFNASDFGYKTFLELTDTPSSYSAKAGFIPSVNSGQTALEFIATVDLAGYLPVGVQDIFVRAIDMYPTVTAGCAAIASTEVTNVTFRSLDFDTTTEENAQFAWSFPRNWDRGVIAIKAYWTAGSGSGGVAIGFKGIALSDDDPLSGSFGTEVVVTDTLIAANDVHITAYSGNITIGGSPVDSDLVVINIARKTGNAADTLGVDMKLIGVSIKYTLDSAVAE